MAPYSDGTQMVPHSDLRIFIHVDSPFKMVAMYIGVDPWPIPLSLDWFSWEKGKIQTGTPYT